MGKKKTKGEYNDFLDGEKLRDNTEIRTSLHSNGASSGKVSPPLIRRDGPGKGQGKAKGKAKGTGRPALTHFLCLPLVNTSSRPQLEKSLDGFKKELEKDGLIPLKAVRPVGTLHLTLGVMALDVEQLEDAGRFLQDLDLRTLLRDATSKAGQDMSLSDDHDQDKGPLSINLKSLVPMQAQQKTSIIYAEPQDATARLYAFASALRDEFVSRGFLIEDTRPLKLHATIINTIYAKARGSRSRPAATAQSSAHPDDSKLQEQDRSQGHGPNAKSLIRFDATDLVEQYKDFFWAQDVRIEKVQICKMGAKKVMDEAGDVVSEEYEEVFGKGI